LNALVVRVVEGQGGSSDLRLAFMRESRAIQSLLAWGAHRISAPASTNF
jgi:hypothetical protein